VCLGDTIHPASDCADLGYCSQHGVCFLGGCQCFLGWCVQYAGMGRSTHRLPGPLIFKLLQFGDDVHHTRF
jgi:syndecan 1